MPGRRAERAGAPGVGGAAGRRRGSLGSDKGRRCEHDAGDKSRLQQPKGGLFHGANDTDSKLPIASVISGARGGPPEDRHREPRDANQCPGFVDDVDAPNMAAAADVHRAGGARDKTVAG